MAIDVIIRPVGVQATGTDTIGIQFVASFTQNGMLREYSTTIEYVHGATRAQEETAIINAVKAAYTSVTGEAVPATGINYRIFGVYKA